MHKKPIHIIIFFATIFLAACASSHQTIQTATVNPQADLFSGLPFHLVGETVELGDYAIQVESIILNPDTIQVSATLTNNSNRSMDLSGALKLYAPDGFSISPEDVDGMLEPGNSLQREFVYNLPAPFVQDQVMGYRLLYTPFGWSGPVTVYLLVEKLPDVSPPPTHPVIPYSYNGTGDPWKMLILIYPNIDVDYVENGETKHLTASMPPADLAAMRADYMDNQPHQKIVYDYSDHTAEVEANVIVVDRPLTTLEPIGSGYWPDPGITHPELDLYAPPGMYDSVIVFWQASDPNTGQSLPVYGWGLGYWPYDYANGMTYATVFNISWVWPNDQCHGEVFLHEWLHGVTGFYKDHLGFPFNIDDLHGAEEAGYQWDYDQDGCWDMWLRDYMRGLVYENGLRKALVPETWQSGSITTHHIYGWRGEYFSNETLSGIPVLVRDDANINFEWESNSPHPLVPDDHFSTRWTRNIYFDQGDYTFELFRDDGIRLIIDNVPVLEAWNYGREWVSTTRSMTQGDHSIVVEAFEIDGWASAVFRYQLDLTINKTGSGDGTIVSDPAGINCGVDCSYSFPNNIPITLTAVPANGSTFTGWNGGGCSGIDPCTLTLTGHTSITANFNLLCTDCGPANSAWPLYRQNALHTGRSSNSGPENPAVKWTYDAFSYDGSSPVIGPDGIIYVGLSDTLYAFYSNGEIKWSYIAGGAVRSPAISANGTVYAGSADGKLYAFNADGSLKWSFTTEGLITDSPVLSPEGIIYFGSFDGKLYALWPDGTLKWSYTIGSWQNPSPAIGPDGTIYQGSTTWSVYALTPDGHLKWAYPTDNYVDASPAVGTDGTVYIGSIDHYLYALNPNGTLKWRYSTGDNVWSPGIGADGTIYAGSDDNYLYAINPQGTLKWRYLTAGFVGTPSIDANGVIYVGSRDGYLYAINPSGSLKWRVLLEGYLDGGPIIGPDITLYVTSGGKLFVIGNDSTQSIPLVTGWNLVSFRLHPTSTAITDVLSSLGSNYDLVYAWDASGGHASAGNWMRYAPGIPGNTLTTLDESQGFWIRMTAADTLEITGSVPTTTNISLLTTASGWNLVGYPSMVNRSMPDALTAHGVTAYSLVYAYHAEDPDTWKRYAPGVPGNDLVEVAPPWAYWIKVTAANTWHVEY